jgi:hypothetical protein
MKHTHYIPATNESEFNHIAKVCDPVLIKRRERAAAKDIVAKRNALLRELSDLRYKPRRTVEDDRRMDELSAEVRALMMQIGRLGK